MARTKDPSAATVKAWLTRKRNADKAGASATVAARAFGMEGKPPAGDYNPTGDFTREAVERLRAYEGEHQGDGREHAMALDSKGNVLFVSQGTATTVALSPSDTRKLYASSGAVVTHNHPDGSPPSADDLLLVASKDCREIRATGPNGVLHRAGTTAGYWDPEMVETFQQIRDATRSRTQSKINAGTMTLREANAGLPEELHRVWTEFAELYAKDGVYYKRTKGGNANA